VTIKADQLNIREGPATSSLSLGMFQAGTYLFDLLDTERCWVQVRSKIEPNLPRIGWVYAEYLEFEFDNHLTKPNKTLSRKLSAQGVYELVASSTYKIMSSAQLGSAVAISSTVLLTNCHVLSRNKHVLIVEGNRRYDAIVIHDNYSKDKCFIRSLALKVNPVPNVRAFNRIRTGERAYTIGAPQGVNRTLNKGIISNKHIRNSRRLVQTTAPIDDGSSGGGLFDSRGNLLGITSFSEIPGKNLNFAIAAEDFWR